MTGRMVEALDTYLGKMNVGTNGTSPEGEQIQMHAASAALCITTAAHHAAL